MTQKEREKTRGSTTDLHGQRDPEGQDPEKERNPESESDQDRDIFPERRERQMLG